MPFNIRIISTYPPRRCGIGTFSRDLATALAHFTAEVGHIRVAAIDNRDGPYDIPVDLTIDQYDPNSWRNAITHVGTRASEASNRAVVALQHEFGLDPGPNGELGHGTNFVELARAFQEMGLITVVYLHTVLDDPTPHERTVTRDLAEYSDGLIVTTESAIRILESERYGIAHEKLKHIDHGVRMHQLSQFDRLGIKTEWGLDKHFLITTFGMLSPGKGIEYGIRAYGRFLEESCTPQQRRNIVYLIAGKFHPEFVRANGGRDYQQFQATLQEAIEAAKVRHCRVTELAEADFETNDVIFLDAFLDEQTLLKLYGATNVMLLPYLNMQQISSGILADTLGSGRAAVTTKFRYAQELIHSNNPCPDGLIIGRYARGILVDPGEPSVQQIAQALDYLVFNEGKRLMMERQAHQRGYQMRWDNSAWALLQYVLFIHEAKRIVTGRGVKFSRQRASVLDVHKYRRVHVTPTVDVIKHDAKAVPQGEELAET